jgi:hypothetical protein
MSNNNGKLTPEIKIIRGQKAPPLHFGEQFFKWDSAKKISYLSELAASQNQALDMMQQERNMLAEQVKVLNQQLENLDSALAQQKQIMRDALTKQNEDDQQASVRIQQLERQLSIYRKIVQLVNTDHAT